MSSPVVTRTSMLPRLNSPPSLFLVGLLLAVPLVLTAVLVLMTACRKPSPPSEIASGTEPQYVGRETCQRCHRQETLRWSGSHHDLAMQPAADSTIRAPFDSTTVQRAGESALFFRTDSAYYARTEGPDGATQNYPIRYTFGVEPLQQYLVEIPGGRLQALNVSWDTRKKEWFHLYPEEELEPGDPLHWTGRLHTWNTMCASCHSTNLRKNYNPESDTYATKWSEIDVSCEACHGPGSRHVAWARSEEDELADSSRGATRSSGPRHRFKGGHEESAGRDNSYGLTVDLNSADSEAEIQTCAPCHSRRQKISPDSGRDRPGEPFLDHYAPQLLREGLYHPDGQINDEVYVYGSFLQSKMYRRGVRCTDCHEPHSLELRREGNALCTQCHNASSYDRSEHHFHPESSTGARCVNCHMPGKTYMQIDFRRDHSIRIPRPDLSMELGTPNACTRCHTDRSDEWAAKAAQRWYGDLGSDSIHYGEVFAAARARESDAAPSLIQTVRDTGRPRIVRATALSLLGRYSGDQVTKTLREGLRAPSPLMRYAAAGAFRQPSPSRQVSALGPLLRDSVRAVRIEAARTLASVPESAFSSDRLDAFQTAFQEYTRAMKATSERPGSQLNLGVAYQQRGQTQKARDAFQTALRLDSSFVPALMQLARLNNQQGQNEKAETLLRRAVSLRPENGEAHYMLGLLLAEAKGLAEASTHLAKAARLLPDRPRVQYNYGLALQRLGRPKKAATFLQKAHELRPASPDFLYALAVLYAQQNQWQKALPHAQELARLQPRSRRAQGLLQQIRRRMDEEGGSGS